MALPVLKTKRANVIADAVRNPRIIYESNEPRLYHGDVWAACWYKQHIGQIMFDDIHDEFIVWIHAGGYRLYESRHKVYVTALEDFQEALSKAGFPAPDEPVPLPN